MRYLMVPGWTGSGPDHWQTHWERELPGASRVEMPDWDNPRRTAWLATLDRAIALAGEPPILIAHSLGCAAVAHWAAHARAGAVRGALLVAPPDLDRPDCPPVLRDFAPVPRAVLAFPTHVVASDDDPFISLARASDLADAWGATLTVLRGAGHINTGAGFGPWPAGQQLLRTLETCAAVAGA